MTDKAIPLQFVIQAPTTAPPSFNGDLSLYASNLFLMTAMFFLGLMMVRQGGRTLRQRQYDHSLDPVSLYRLITTFAGAAVMLRFGSEALLLWGWTRSESGRWRCWHDAPRATDRLLGDARHLVFVSTAALIATSLVPELLGKAEVFGLGTITGGLIGILRVPSSRTVTVDTRLTSRCQWKASDDPRRPHPRLRAAPLAGDRDRPSIVIVTAAVALHIRYVQGLEDADASLRATTRDQAMEISAAAQNAGALENAATARVANTLVITEQRKERDDTIARAPAGAPGPATLRANCVGWQAQHPGKAAPAACR